MATMTIRHIDETLKQRLRVQAARHGRSMEEEARDILRTALAVEPTPPLSLVQSVRERVAPWGGIDLELPVREPIRSSVEFGT